jgi:thymidylate synthase (FAD)
MKIPVLDHGYVRLLDCMGSDDDIAENARVSTDYATPKRKNERLIHYLMKNRHTSPFELAVLKFEIKLPVFVERQMVRHRTASMNEQSARMSELEPEFYIPPFDAVGVSDPKNKQGRTLSHQLSAKDREAYRESLRRTYERAYHEYQNMLQVGVPRELARLTLPVSIYTKKVWQMDLHNLLHFLSLRLAPDAQWEIRQYAQAIEQIVAELFPVTHGAWQEMRGGKGQGESSK